MTRTAPVGTHGRALRMSDIDVGMPSTFRMEGPWRALVGHSQEGYQIRYGNAGHASGTDGAGRAIGICEVSCEDVGIAPDNDKGPWLFRRACGLKGVSRPALDHCRVGQSAAE